MDFLKLPILTFSKSFFRFFVKSVVMQDLVPITFPRDFHSTLHKCLTDILFPGWCPSFQFSFCPNPLIVRNVLQTVQFSRLHTTNLYPYWTIFLSLVLVLSPPSRFVCKPPKLPGILFNAWSFSTSVSDTTFGKPFVTFSFELFQSWGVESLYDLLGA